MDILEKEIGQLLAESCRRFVVHGITHVLEENKTDTDVIQSIINMQAALDILAKLYQLKTDGWKSVVDKKHHNESEEKLIEMLARGELKTNQYWKSKEYINRHVGFFEYERELLDRFQSYRNSAVHMGLKALPNDIESDVLILLLRVINTLNWDENMPDGTEYIENHVSKYLGDKLFQRLMLNPTYLGEAVDQAYDHCVNVHTCLECGNESWGETDLDEALCFSCGYKVPMDLIGFESCPECDGVKSVVYDKIQGHGVKVSAKCTECGTKYFLAYCADCGHATRHSDAWECSICKSFA